MTTLKPTLLKSWPKKIQNQTMGEAATLLRTRLKIRNDSGATAVKHLATLAFLLMASGFYMAGTATGMVIFWWQAFSRRVHSGSGFVVVRLGEHSFRLNNICLRRRVARQKVSIAVVDRMGGAPLGRGMGSTDAAIPTTSRHIG